MTSRRADFFLKTAGSGYFHLILIAALGIIIYSNTLGVPFQGDEDVGIVDNPIVKELKYFTHPSKAKNFGIYYTSFRDRYMGYLSFALNYRIHGLDVTGYHVVNIALHIFNAMLVYALLRLTLRAVENITPPSPPLNLRGGREGLIQYIPLFVALIFVSHPVQTEAVTYIMSRLPLLMWFFYLSSMVLYAKWRGSQTPFSGGYPALYLISLLCAVLAMKTKENALSLPFSIALYEFLFFEGPFKRRLPYLLPFVLTLLVIPLSLFSFDKPVTEVLGNIESASRHYTDMSRASYLFTQFRVLVTYIRLLFLPINQNFAYDYPVYSSFFVLPVFGSFVFLAVVLAMGIYLIRRSKNGSPALRLMGWGILWFFITVSVESSIIPLPNTICEYRLYVPLIGFFLSLLTFVFYRSELTASRGKYLRFLLIGVVAIFAVASYARNTVWKDTITLWEDVVKKSPGGYRELTKLGEMYEDKGRFDRAIAQYDKALALQPYFGPAHRNLGRAYSAMGRLDEAIEHHKIFLEYGFDEQRIHLDIGKLYARKKDYDNAILHFNKALPLGPGVYFYIGKALEEKGDTAAAKEYFTRYRLAKESMAVRESEN